MNNPSISFDMRLHASCVALDGRAVLIMGASGSGKSALAMQLMVHGARLVSDDQVLLDFATGFPVASAPYALRGMIEARGIGILAATPEGPTRVVLAITMDQIETARLPPDRTLALGDFSVPLLHKLETPYFTAAIVQYMKAGKANI